MAEHMEIGSINQSLAEKHEFRRYIRRMIGRRMAWQAMCWCGWTSKIGPEIQAWDGWYNHHEDQLRG